MNTLKSIKDCIKKYADAIDAVAKNAKNEDEYNSGMASAEKAFKDQIHEIRNAFPELVQIDMNNISEDQALQFVKTIKEHALQNYTPVASLPIPSNFNLRDNIGGKWIETPSFTKFDKDGFYSLEDSSNTDELDNFLLFLLMSYPLKKVRFTFVDLEQTLKYQFFAHNISPILWNNSPISTESELQDLIARLNKRVVDVTKEYGDYEKYVSEHSDMPLHFEVVVVLSETSDSEQSIEKLKKVCKRSVGTYYVSYANQVNSKKIQSFSYANQVNSKKIHSSETVDFQNNKSYYSSDFAPDYIKGFRITVDPIFEKETGGSYMPDFISELKSKGIPETVYELSVKLGRSILVTGKGEFTESYGLCLCEFFNIENSKGDCYSIDIQPYKTNDLFTEELRLEYFRKGCVSFTTKIKDIKQVKRLIRETGLQVVRFDAIEDTTANILVGYTPMVTNPILLKTCVDYINSEAEKKEEARIVTQDIDALGVTPYESLGDVIELPVGVSGKREINFRMDLVSHVHSFIIGQSGSGKSVFLHNVIGSAIMKYAPEDLELYLLDFKLGGVEFNRYQGVKHVKAMLVDNSDQQITLEILRELRERMAERGKLLRNAGVSNLSEYNKLHPDSKLPHVLLVADECHEMFKQDSSIPRNISNAISDIVIKIAKEGRSQGVHLILATQTLSGTEISNEILNNVSDHYLLKCAAVDSERMVSGSADITSELTTGQIYYHHVEEQSRFQAFFTSKEDAAKLIDLVKKKAASHQSNGEFYFNGAQLFHLQKDVFGDNVTKLAKAPVAYVGKTIDINQCDLAITFRKDFSENLLLIGLNDSEQLTRTTMNAMISLMAATKRVGKDMNFKVFNCLQNEDSIYAALLDKLESKGYCELIDGRKERAVVLKNLVDDIQNETAKDTMLFILGQDKFRELKMDAELESVKTESSMSLSDDFFSTSSSSSSKAKTFKQAMDIILDKGPEFGVHVIMQLEKPTNFLFDDYVSPKRVFQKFKHLVMLRSDESVAASLHLNDTIRLETLSSDEERLRAYYYAEESDTYTMFTPYVTMDINEIEKFIENK